MPKRILSLLSVVTPLILASCVALQGGFSPPEEHPWDLKGNLHPACTDCHAERTDELAYIDFNHDAYFADNHKQQAYRNEQVCGMCHQTSFCNNCHATDIELKPSIKNQTNNYRRTPHRGDYLSRHRIDGAVDPTSCFRCHGNPKSAAGCVRCHG